MEFHQQRRKIGLPEARVRLAQVAILDGQASLGLQEARTAVREFSYQGRPAGRRSPASRCYGHGWPPVSGMVPRDRRRRPVLERAADDLGEAGWPFSALEARAPGWPACRPAGLDQQSPRAIPASGPAPRPRARAAARPGLVRRSAPKVGERQPRRRDGRRPDCAAHHGRAPSGLGATDLRAHASGHRVEVAEFGLRIAFDSGQPARVLEWAEQGRASHLMLRPVRPPSDSGLAAALWELRITVSEIFKLKGAGGRHRHAGAPASRAGATDPRPSPPPSSGTGRQAHPAAAGTQAPRLTGDAALLEFIRLGDTLHAVMVAGGRVRLFELGPAAQAQGLIGRVRFALHRLARRQASDASYDAARAARRCC